MVGMKHVVWKRVGSLPVFLGCLEQRMIDVYIRTITGQVELAQNVNHEDQRAAREG